MDWLTTQDTQAFYGINHGMANPILDACMPVLTNVKYWMPVYVVGLALLVWRGGMRGRVCALVLLVCILVSDSFNSRILKEWVQRERPSTSLADARVIAPAAGGKSFPSTHATNNFAAALILTSFYRRRLWLWYCIAVLIAFSRVYVGVHYPLDVLGGALEGSAIAALLILAQRRWIPLPEVPPQSPVVDTTLAG